METDVEDSTRKGRPRLVAWVCRAVLGVMVVMVLWCAGSVVREMTRSVPPPDAKRVNEGARVALNSTARPKDHNVIDSVTLALVMEGKQDLIPIPESLPQAARVVAISYNEQYRNVLKALADYWAGKLEIKGDPYDYFNNMCNSMNMTFWLTGNHADFFKKEDIEKIRETVIATDNRIAEAMLDCLVKQRRWYNLAQWYKSRGDWDSELYYLRQMGPAGRSVIISRVTERFIGSIFGIASRNVRTAEVIKTQVVKGS